MSDLKNEYKRLKILLESIDKEYALIKFRREKVKEEISDIKRKLKNHD